MECKTCEARKPEMMNSLLLISMANELQLPITRHYGWIIFTEGLGCQKETKRIPEEPSALLTNFQNLSRFGCCPWQNRYNPR